MTTAEDSACGKASKKSKVDPSALPEWSSELKLVEVFNDMQFSLLDGVKSRVEPDRAAFDPEWNLRETLSIIATNVERKNIDGKTLDYMHMVQNPEKTEGIVIKVVDVRRLPDELPLVLVHYWYSTVENRDNVEILKEILKRRDVDNMMEGMYSISTEKGELPLLLELLQKNEKRLDPEYKKRMSEQLPRAFRISFFSPLKGGPKPSEEAKKEMMCVSCGKPKRYQCARCRRKSYCSRDCQVKHWPEHKANCRKLSDVPFIEVDTRNIPEELTYGMTLSWIQPGFNQQKKQEPFNMKKNGEAFDIGQIFAVKIQVPICGTDGGPLSQSMLLYDKDKKLQTHIWPGSVKQGVDGFSDLFRVIRVRGDLGMRMFVLAEYQGNGYIKLYYDTLLPHPGW